MQQLALNPSAMCLVSSVNAYFSQKFFRNSIACYPEIFEDGTWNRNKAFLDNFEMVDLIDVSLEFFYELSIEIEGELPFDIMMEDEFEDTEGKFVPQPIYGGKYTFC